ncbi:DUF654-domain-containing protein [Sporormia fimetaria CBS 119925]|uniref:DUF654-domain-containing protein n=1 Tax=Sporormia fimetaria CBS 119925 TaxID=1340428 RepID=A0A6A6V6U8_9PLEO|nr:DUF654-domain-containing protein [Sporormia fimetaria CBS 119925]
MSSRAIRRAQQELEKQRQEEAKLAGEGVDDTTDEEPEPVPQPKPSLFALLADADDGADEDDEEEEVEEAAKPAITEEKTDSGLISQAPKSKKSKKKKKKKAQKNEPAAAPPPDADGLDEIDRALQELQVASQDSQQSNAKEGELNTNNGSKAVMQLCEAVAVDSQHLRASNELRKFFGNVAAGNDRDENPRARPRGGRDYTPLAYRNNLFIPLRDTWPKPTPSGLSMEVVNRQPDGIVEYRFVHNTAYQEVQADFNMAVATMDPQQLLLLLRRNPYHISTLLQVSQIFRQQREHAEASDLVERALFAFGRALHHSFAKALAEGKARLSFRHPENRELWLTVWRYIGSLRRRSLWRTALEYARMLIGFAPGHDPYCLRLVLDHYALQAGEPEKLMQTAKALKPAWKNLLPNLAYSMAIAEELLKEPQSARARLKKAIILYPWIAARLCKELDISPIPPSIWGKEPVTWVEEMFLELYIPHAKDMWGTPQASALLVEVAYTLDKDSVKNSDKLLAPHLEEMVEIDIFRHIYLRDDPALLSHIPQELKDEIGSESDPLPPHILEDTIDPL